MEAILHYNEVKDHEIDAFTTQAHIERKTFFGRRNKASSNVNFSNTFSSSH